MSGQALPVLVIEGGYAAWRALALRALSAGWRPEHVTWVERSPGVGTVPVQLTLDDASQAALPDVTLPSRVAAIGDGAESLFYEAAPLPTVRVSRALSGLLQDAALYRSPQRWAFLYRILWRWQQGERSVASAADEDGARLHAMAKAVRRARHDMIAYVRFRQCQGSASPAYFAWYEPDHDVLAYAAEHFARRMGNTSWCIGTPQGAAWWDGHTLRLIDAPAQIRALRDRATEDDIEPLWLLYYQNIFNPARLNETALQQHMPVRFWRHLPEGQLIPGLIAQARAGLQRSGQSGAVGGMSGKQVAVDAQRALPQRALPSSLEQCRRCTLWQQATQAVPGQGPETARVMLIGEQPGDHEDLAGRVFVGPAGKLLDTALHCAGLPRDSIYLTNAVKHFKWVARGKHRLHKTPAQQEIDACAHWLQQELTRVRPAVIVTLGATALGAVMGRSARLRDYLAQPVRLEDAWLVATWHPAHALRAGAVAQREGITADIVQALIQARDLASA